LPPGAHMEVVTDAAIYTEKSFNTIRKTLAEAAVFTGLILLLFLHTWRSTLIVLVAIPTSILTTLGLMSILGLNLNLLSMLALTPLLASRSLRSEEALKTGGGPLAEFGRRWDRGFETLGQVYQRLLYRVLTGKFLGIGARWTVIAVGLFSFVIGAGLAATGR